MNDKKDHPYWIKYSFHDHSEDQIEEIISKYELILIDNNSSNEFYIILYGSRPIKLTQREYNFLLTILLKCFKKRSHNYDELLQDAKINPSEKLENKTILMDIACKLKKRIMETYASRMLSSKEKNTIKKKCFV